MGHISGKERNWGKYGSRKVFLMKELRIALEVLVSYAVVVHIDS